MTLPETLLYRVVLARPSLAILTTRKDKVKA